MSLEAEIKGRITEELNKRNVTVTWLPDLSTNRKFSYNTNIRHEDEMGQDLDLKSITELCDEFKHSGTELVLLLHNNKEHPCNGQMIFYGSLDE